ncbi:MAG: hypothetical protein NUW37_17100, partial [Planctomycetes bacterium]|nr:hypothetical protein [Planctomycetota bacterium]
LYSCASFPALHLETPEVLFSTLEYTAGRVAGETYSGAKYKALNEYSPKSIVWHCLPYREQERSFFMFETFVWGKIESAIVLFHQSRLKDVRFDTPDRALLLVEWRENGKATGEDVVLAIREPARDTDRAYDPNNDEVPDITHQWHISVPDQPYLRRDSPLSKTIVEITNGEWQPSGREARFDTGWFDRQIEEEERRALEKLREAHEAEERARRSGIESEPRAEEEPSQEHAPTEEAGGDEPPDSADPGGENQEPPASDSAGPA